jgi:hypothetical protein
MENKKQESAVEWLVEQLNLYEYEDVIKQAKEMEKQRMIDLVQQLKDYTRESNNVLGFDEREASEFVEIFYNKTYKSE